MDDDIFMDLDIINAKKTYSNKLRKEPQLRRLPLHKKGVDDVEIPQPLTTKVAVKFLLEGKLKSKVCRYCLNITPGLSELDQIMKIGGIGNIYKVTIRDIVASFHPFKVVDDPNFPNKICQKCLDKALGAYLFTQQCERAERAMLNCFDDMYEKFEKLDPIDRPKKRGRQKLNPNYNILHAEHYRVMEYAEPIINIVNVGAETVSKEPELNDLECKKCWQVLPNLESLINHEKIHPKTMWYHCRLCGKSFPKCNQLKRHNNRVHVLGKEPTSHADKDFKCKECSHVTDNVIQHLQHVEKHKFKNIMQHLIEKRMDKLCVVCYNKGTKMTDLDKMVCIYGCHPDLMGDKMLYTLLATTLPNPKSYKYQDLCLPSYAPIMTISTKQNNRGHQKALKPVTTNSNKKHFTFSSPIIISREEFKTDHFYCYIFCYPEILSDASDTVNQDDVCKISGNATKTKVVEIVDICDIEKESLCTEVSISSENTIINNNLSVKDIVSDETAANCSGRPDAVAPVTAHRHDKINNTIVKEITKGNLNVRNYTFSSPDILTDNDLGLDTGPPNTSRFIVSNSLHKSFEGCDKSVRLEITDEAVKEFNISEYLFSNPQYEDIESLKFELKEKAVTADNGKWNQDLCKKCWVFDNTYDDHKSHNTTTKSDKKAKCEFCWIFNQTGYCSSCKTPIEPQDICTTSIDPSCNKSQNRNTNQLVENKIKIWQCEVCLINNDEERLSCQCCGSMRITQHSDVKITFGNNIFFQRKEMEDHTHPNNLVLATKDFNKVTVTEEVSMMDCKNNFEDNNETATININMDTDMATFKVNTTTNDAEAMDVEECPLDSSEGFQFPPLWDFNIQAIPSAMSANSAVITPVIKPSVRFSMGCAVTTKSLKKYRRIIRNMPKAFHK